MLSNFKKRCRSLKKLDLSWCGTHTTNEKAFFNAVLGFIEECCKQLTHLSLCHCEIVNNAILCKIPCCKELTELRLRNVKVDSHAFHCLSKLTKLITLDLSTTKISDEPLNAILKANPLLKHINLDFCEHVELLDQVVETATIFNKNLITWSSFKATTLTHTGGMLFARFTKLRELDLGWCFLLTHPGDSMMIIADGCRDLKRLILSQWRGANDQMLLFVISCCKKLTQLDLLGINGITGDFCEEALRTLPDLKLLEISFCDRIQDEQVFFNNF
jgi:F-box/leucine-rich repeat protein 4